MRNCPFCESDDTRVASEAGRGWQYWVQCEGCHTMGPRRDSAHGAIDAWEGLASVVEPWDAPMMPPRSSWDRVLDVHDAVLLGVFGLTVAAVFWWFVL